MPVSRERFQGYGVSAADPAESEVSCLSDAQLLALWLRTGEAGRPVTDLAQDLLDRHGGIAGLLHAPPPDFGCTRSPRKRTELRAVLELARRTLVQQLVGRDAFTSPGVVKSYLQLELARRPHEVFAVLFLDAQNALIEMNVMFRGTLTQTSVYPREIVVHALKVGASAVVLAHNHPSGTVEPSRADIALTQTIKSALALVDVRVLDHVIVAPGASLSMAERGMV